jgi:hypothetical protein
MFYEHKLSYLAAVKPQSHLSDTHVHTRDSRCPAIEQTDGCFHASPHVPMLNDVMQSHDRYVAPALGLRGKQRDLLLWSTRAVCVNRPRFIIGSLSKVKTRMKHVGALYYLSAKINTDNATSVHQYYLLK